MSRPIDHNRGARADPIQRAKRHRAGTPIVEPNRLRLDGRAVSRRDPDPIADR